MNKLVKKLYFQKTSLKNPTKIVKIVKSVKIDKFNKIIKLHKIVNEFEST